MTAATSLEAEARTVVQTFYAALGRGDVPAVLALATDDVCLTQSPRLPWGGRFIGREELGRFAAGVRAHIASEVRVERLVAAGSRVAAVGTTYGTVMATGQAFEVPLVHLFTVQDGQVAALEVLVDVPAMLAALPSSTN